MKIGILALQGAFIEHKYSLDALGAESFEIRQKKDIEKPFDGLIYPRRRKYGNRQTSSQARFI